MSALCPHLFQAYLAKASDILDIYEPQISSIVVYGDISESLLDRHLLKKREDRSIRKCNTESERMAESLRILRKRMWGLENLITVLIEKNIDSWLTEELFQAYVRHLVSHLKKIQARKSCECYETGSLSLVQCSWFLVLEKLDTWLLEAGTSLGCLTLPLHPLKKLLDFIRKRLNVESKLKTLSALTATDAIDSDSDVDDDQKFLNSAGGCHLTRTVGTDTDLDLPVLSPSVPEIESFGKLEFEDDPHHPNSRDSKNLEEPSDETFLPDLEWDTEGESYLYSTLEAHRDSILEFFDQRERCSSLSSSSSLHDVEPRILETMDMGIQTIPIEQICPTSPLVSVSTQTTRQSSPVSESKLNSQAQKPMKPTTTLKQTPQPPTVGTKRESRETTSTKNGKVATVPPSRRSITDYRSKKRTASILPAQTAQERLKPEDYTKWANSQRTKLRMTEAQTTNVA